MPARFDLSPPIPLVRELMMEYARDIDIDLCFQGFESELKNLPGQYAEPRGCLIVVFIESHAAAIGALRPTSPDVCEMKRLFVRPAFRGVGVGRQIAQRLIIEARQRGYRAMRLDTLSVMSAAVTLYKSLGFRRIAPYNSSPLEACVYFELTLSEDL